MKQLVALMEKIGTPLILVLCIFTFFRSCSTGATVNKLEKQVGKIDSLVNTGSKLSQSEVDSIVKNRLYDFLIFEEDLDKGKTSLSDIRLKISGNEK
jgi:hypothetical protein